MTGEATAFSAVTAKYRIAVAIAEAPPLTANHVTSQLGLETFLTLGIGWKIGFAFSLNTCIGLVSSSITKLSAEADSLSYIFQLSLLSGILPFLVFIKIVSNFYPIL